MPEAHPQFMHSAPFRAFIVAMVLCLTALPTAQPGAPSTSLSEERVAATSSANATGWLASASGANYERITAIVPLSNGSTLVGGTFEQTIEFYGDVVGFSSQDSSFGVDFFIGWIDENGTWTNTSSGSSSGLDSIEAIDLLSDGTILVSGTFCDMTYGDECNMTLGALNPLNKTTLSDENGAFLAAMNPFGEWLWATSYSNEFQMSVVDMEVSTTDEIHLALLHRGQLISGNQSSAGSATEETVALLILDSNGQHMGMQTVFSTDSLDASGSLCMDSFGAMYFTTTYTGTLVFDTHELTSVGGSNVGVAHYNSGGWIWAASAGGAGDSSVNDCAPRPDGGVAIVGDFILNMTVGSIEIPAGVWVDFYEAHVSASGEWLHATSFGGNGADHAVGIHITEQGHSLIVGHTSGSITLGEYTLEDLDGINDGNHHDLFLAQRVHNGNWDWAISGGGNGDELATGIAMSATGSPLVSFISNNDGAFGIHQFDQRLQYDMGLWMYETDLDLDGVLDGLDNCPNLPNSDQLNLDNDAFGDLCDDDADGDGVEDISDDCPMGEVGWGANQNTDHDSDGCRDLNEDLDDDEDGILDSNDLCPKGPIGWISTEETDIERDGCSDVDSDGDTFVDQADNCPNIANPTQADLDNDNIGDVCDDDKDGDGVAIPDDNCPHGPDQWISFTWNDYDGDGCLDSTDDDDDDDDGVLDVDDSCLLGEKNWIDAEGIIDHDSDGCLDSTEDDDDDNDGKKDPFDRCPRGLIGLAQPGQDRDDDGCIDAVEDDDDDQDGVLDPLDNCPNSNPDDQISSDGCSEFQLDGDGDGVFNAYDFCLNSPADAIVDEQGCTTKASATSGASDDEGIGLAGWLFFLAGAIVLWAFVSNNRQLGPPLPPVEASMRPPPVPRDLKHGEE